MKMFLKLHESPSSEMWIRMGKSKIYRNTEVCLNENNVCNWDRVLDRLPYFT